MDERPDAERGPDACPAPAVLIDASEGSLPEARQMAVQAHVVRCAACRDFLQRLDSTTHDFAEYLRGDAEDDDGGGDADRVGDGSGGEAREEDGASKAASGAAARFIRFQHRLHTFKQAQIHRASAWRIGRWLPVAAMLLVLVLGVLLSRPYTTVIRADALLERAVFHERSRPVGMMQRLSVQLTAPAASSGLSTTRDKRLMPGLTPFSMTREVPVGRGNAGAAEAASAGASVTRVTMGAAGAPGSGVEAPRVEAMLARFFADHRFDWNQPLSVHGFQAWRTSRTQRRDHVTRLGSAWRELRTTTTDGLLREVQLVVHADTYHPVKVVMLIDGVGCLKIEKHKEWMRTRPAEPTAAPATLSASAAPARRATEAPALSDDLRLPEPPAASTATVVIPQPGLSRWLDQTFGQRPTRATFMPDLMRRVARVKGRLGTLQQLAARHPEPETLSRAARDNLRAQLDAAYRALGTDLDALNVLVSVLVGSETRLEVAQRAPLDWQRRTAAGATHAATLEQLLYGLFAHEDLPADDSAPHGRGPVRAAFNALWDTVNTSPSAPSPRPN